MTIIQLIERLEEYRKAMGDDIEVRLSPPRVSAV